MSDDTSAQAAAVQPAEPPSVAAATDNKTSESVPVADSKGAGSDETAAGPDERAKANEDNPGDQASGSGPSTAPAKTTAPTNETENATATATDGDVETEDKSGTRDAEAVADSEAAANAIADDATAAAAKSQPRRKSTGVTDKTKKLNRKASKAKILHLDAKPGDHYFAKLKGFPPWPVVICEEDMLPQTMLNSRPVTAARADGTYREDFAEGGKRTADRTFPVMYLHTNEFSWTPNTDLTELDPSTVKDMITGKMRKDLQSAHELASQNHDIDYYKNVLREFEEQRLVQLEAKKSRPKVQRRTNNSKINDGDGDLEMEDVEDETAEPAKKKSKAKKRKAEDENNTPQRSDSVKKPKIKLTNTSTPKAANGVQSPAAKDSAKSSKAKAQSAKGSKAADSKKEKEPAAPKEPELTPEERRARKEKEILFLRHRLQRGLLPRVGQPVPEEMKQVSDFLAKLETFPDLDVSIIRATKINKVLKAILKIETIPREDEFRFKPRSQVLLDKWNILLASDAAPAPAAASSSATANGVNGASAAVKASKEAASSVKDEATESKNEPEKSTVKTEAEQEDKEPVETKDASSKTELAGREVRIYCIDDFIDRLELTEVAEDDRGGGQG
ncbi:hypothetical protein GGS21DRAFT_458885 [Xylaria nigripes]|nr:hypothetical protein GGS21DRAFT_458885 [Xylaria nigripes]